MHSGPQVRAGWSDTRADECSGIAVSTVSVKDDRTVEICQIRTMAFRFPFMLHIPFFSYLCGFYGTDLSFVLSLPPFQFVTICLLRFQHVSMSYSLFFFYPFPPLPLFDLLLIEQAMASFSKINCFIKTIQGEIITELDPLLSVPRTYPTGTSRSLG
ncbi:hypothetical protein M747DRAFT_150442 [Aspergillus niger ATCC 13496]|uniref:Uncharacterized protein n=1 Tax=Aspergillus niger ATCC 13496 TaxID=1353008 RepID=A0A370C6G7_ASPNG|nr:hypothetical protein M747DRAFT_150442 [Aspergillus niger ATCC 13496]